MKKVLIAVDDTKSSKAVLSAFYNLVMPPKEAVILHVEKLQGRSLMIDMLGEAEMSTLKESLKGTEYKEALDLKAEKILGYYREELEGCGTAVKTMVAEGHPAEEILRVSEKEGAELIILGCSNKKGIQKLLTGSVSRDVGKNPRIPVLTAKKPTMCEEEYTWRDAYYAASLLMAIVLVMFIFGMVLEKSGAF